jgi:hypothetical protein
MMNEYLLDHRLARERAAEVHAGVRWTAYAPSAGVPAGPARRHLVETVRRALTVRDLGRLALVSFLVMLLGIGVVGLWTAATEPRPPRTQIGFP